MSGPIRVVFDTNVLISAALSGGGKPRRSLDHVLTKGLLLLSRTTSDEVARVVAYPHLQKYLSAVRKKEFLDQLASAAVWVEPSERIEACRDPKDDKFLEAAVAGAADYLVSGGEDLLVLHPFRSIAILTPAAFLEEVGDEPA